MDMVPVIWQRRLTVWQKSRRFLICLAGGILYILLTDAFSLGYERNSTKFAINCSLSADVRIQSVSRIYEMPQVGQERCRFHKEAS